MDFFEQQHQARQRTGWLLLYFFFSILGTILAIYCVGVLLSLYLFREAPLEEGYSTPSQEEIVSTLINPSLLLSIAGGTTLVVLIGSGAKLMELRSGGGAVATALGGRRLDAHPKNLNEKKLFNVVEEMAIASGTPVPEIYLLDHQESINAFAAGYCPSNAAIGVTRGCIEQLSREELQGVIAHEFSHILNGDMRLNTRLISLLAGLLGLTVLGRLAFEFGIYSKAGNSQENRGGNLYVIIVGVLILIIGSIGLFFGRLIQAAISRQREFLADASSVQFTRNPRGLLGTLAKIQLAGSRVQHAEAEEVSHMFFGNGLEKPWFQAMATHPPLEDRMLQIDPTGQIAEEVIDKVNLHTQRKKREQKLTPDKHKKRQSLIGTPDLPEWGVLLGTALHSGDINNPATAALQPSQQEHLEHATTLHQALPETLKEAAHETLGAAALVYALLFNPEESYQKKQLAMLGPLHPAIREETKRLAPSVLSLPMALRLPLLDISLPALRQLSLQQYLIFRQKLMELACVDHQTTLFEFTLQRSVQHHLDIHFGQAKPPKIKYHRTDQALPSILCLLSSLAYLGQKGEAIENAFQRGASQLASSQQQHQLLSPEACGLPQVSHALDEISLADPLVKRNVLFAAANTAMASGKINDQEAELIRLIADSLDCPIPPFLQRKQQEQILSEKGNLPT